jgi:actin beta/gamma 1
MLGIHELIRECVTQCDMDVRKAPSLPTPRPLPPGLTPSPPSQELYQSVLLSGGTTLFQGFQNRLAAEVQRFTPEQVRAKVLAPNERQFSVWIGGSILGSLTTFRQMWISADEYHEMGPSIVHRKCV